MGGEFGKSGGLDLEEFTVTLESFLHDSSSFSHHSSDGVVLGKDVLEFGVLSFVFGVEVGEGLFSVGEFLFSVGLLFGSVFEDGAVDHVESFVFGIGGFKFVFLSVHFGHIRSARISNDTVAVGKNLLLFSETFSNIFKHVDNMFDVVFGLGFEFYLDSSNEGFSKVGVF